MLREIRERGLILSVVPATEAASAEDMLNVKPTRALTHELLAQMKANKPALLKIVREDEKMERTGVIVCEHQVFDLAREFFGDQDTVGAA